MKYALYNKANVSTKAPTIEGTKAVPWEVAYRNMSKYEKIVSWFDDDFLEAFRFELPDFAFYHPVYQCFYFITSEPANRKSSKYRYTLRSASAKGVQTLSLCGEYSNYVEALNGLRTYLKK
jgi:hypothetical protein